LRLLTAAELRLQFFDTRVSALERLVLDEGCLHQRVRGLRRASQAVSDHALGSRVTGATLQFGQAIEQFFHQFLLLSVSSRRLSTRHGRGADAISPCAFAASGQCGRTSSM
jgi:hypothetical protein